MTFDLSKITKGIQKKYSSASLGSEEKEDIEFVSTGNLAFDLCADGGLPWGYITEFSGFSASGKCISGNTKIFIKGRGLVSIEDVSDNKTKDRVVNVNENVLSLGKTYDLFDSTNFYCGGEVETQVLKSKRGFSIEADPTHKIKTLSDSGDIVYKQIGDITVGDIVVMSIGYNDYIFPQEYPKLDYVDNTKFSLSYNLPNTMSEELAELMGYIVANGNSSIKNSIVISTTKDEIKERIVELGKSLFNKEFTVKKRHVLISSLQIKNFLSSLESAGLLSDEKIVPSILWNSPKSCFISFLSAYFNCDGYIDKTGRVEICSASKSLIDSLSFFLFGERIIHRSLAKKSFARNGNIKNVKDYYHIYIENTEHTKLFFDLLTLSKRFEERWKVTPRVDSISIPNCKILVDLIMEEIVVIEGRRGKFSFPIGHGFTKYLGEDLYKKLIRLRFIKDI